MISEAVRRNTFLLESIVYFKINKKLLKVEQFSIPVDRPRTCSSTDKSICQWAVHAGCTARIRPIRLQFKAKKYKEPFSVGKGMQWAKSGSSEMRLFGLPSSPGSVSIQFLRCSKECLTNGVIFGKKLKAICTGLFPLLIGVWAFFPFCQFS